MVAVSKSRNRSATVWPTEDALYWYGVAIPGVEAANCSHPACQDVEARHEDNPEAHGPMELQDLLAHLSEVLGLERLYWTSNANGRLRGYRTPPTEVS